MLGGENCGKDCASCSVFDLCAGCSNSCCLVRRCCLEGFKRVGLTFPSDFCLYRSVCPRATEAAEARTATASQEPSVQLREIPKFPPQPKHSLPKFMPIIKLNDEATWFWNSVAHDALIVRLGELLTDESLLQKVRDEGGIHDFLGFQGDIIASTVMPDELLDRLTGEKYVELLNAVRPDAAMVPDCYTYIDDPLIVSWRQLFKLVNLGAYTIEHVDIPLLGIVKGANQIQVSWCVDSLARMGISTFVLPWRELGRVGTSGRILFKYMLRRIKHVRTKPNVVIYGKPFLKHPFLEYLARGPGVHFASLSWFLSAEQDMAYIGDRKEGLDLNLLYQCDCDFCRGRGWDELITDTRSLALHNLTQIVGLYEGGGS